jgi:hypothetical protein
VNFRQGGRSKLASDGSQILRFYSTDVLVELIGMSQWVETEVFVHVSRIYRSTLILEAPTRKVDSGL